MKRFTKNPQVQEMASINIQCLNIDGMNEEKLTLLEDHMLDDGPDIMGIQETKLTKEALPPNLEISGYHYHVMERSETQKMGGGLIIYHKEDIPIRSWTRPTRSMTKQAAQEVQWLLLEAQTTKIAIANVYLACTSSKNKNYIEWNKEIYSELDEDINDLRDMAFSVILMGDWNGHVGKIQGMEGNNPDVNENGQMLLDFVQRQQLYILNRLNTDENVFTREHYSNAGRLLSQSCLDYMLIAKEAQVGRWSFAHINVADKLGMNTDHKLLKVTGEVNIVRRKPVNKTPRPCFKKDKKNSDYKEQIREKLKKTDKANFRAMSTTEQVHTLHRIMLEASNKTLVMKKIKNRKCSRRVSKTTKSLIAEKKLIQKKIMQEGRKPDLIQQLVTKKLEVKDSILTGMIEHRRKVRLNLALNDPTRKMFWKLTRRNPGKNQGITAVWGPDKTSIVDPPKVRQAVYDSVKARLNGHDEPQTVKRAEQKRVTALGRKLSKPVSEEELKKVISQVKKEKAPGPFNIHGEHIIYGGYHLHGFIRIWLNKLLKTGVVPDFLKQGKVSLLYKRGDCLKPENYRPITLSSVMMKLLTRLLNIRLEQVVEEHNFLSDKQFGFRKSHSTADAVLVASAAIERAKQDDLDAGMASIDLKAAYDMVCRTSLFRKLRELGLNGAFLKLIEDYYNGDSVIYVVGMVFMKDGCSFHGTGFYFIFWGIILYPNALNKLKCLNYFVHIGMCDHLL